jgi:ribosomal protein L29
MIYRPINLKLDELTAYNIEERDHTIAQLRKELKELDTQLRVAKKVNIIFS